MSYKLFLSHDTNDGQQAKALASALIRITLNQLMVWHSSDESGAGGLKPGHVWLDEIRARLNESRAVVVLLTKRSIAKPWVLFETGFGAANPDCDVIPVCIGIDSLSDIPFPLAMYQAYQLSDYASLKRFLEKLLEKYEIPFDEEMAKPVLEDLIKALVKESDEKGYIEESIEFSPNALSIAVSDIKEHLDKRLVGLLSSGLIASGSRSFPSGWYSVPVDIDFPDFQTTQHIEIGEETSVQEVLDNIYRMLKEQVEPFTYLRNWIIQEQSSNVNLIIREVAGWIPANTIFIPNRKWRVVPLSHPYTAVDSDDYLRWYNV